MLEGMETTLGECPVSKNTQLLVKVMYQEACLDNIEKYALKGEEIQRSIIKSLS